MVKFQHLTEHKNPSLTTNLEDVEDGERIDMTTDDFAIAFAVINLLTDETINMDSPLFRLVGITE